MRISSEQQKVDKKFYDEGWDRIWGKKEKKEKEKKEKKEKENARS